MQKAVKTKNKITGAENFKIGIVAAQFNSDITDKILKHALRKLADLKIKHVTVWRVSGSVEIPVILKAAAKLNKYDAFIAIGAIIKGQTDHYHYVAKIVTEGILEVMDDHIIPIGFAVLTTQNIKLAKERVKIGAEAVEAAVQNAKIIAELADI